MPGFSTENPLSEDFNSFQERRILFVFVWMLSSPSFCVYFTCLLPPNRAHLKRGCTSPSFTSLRELLFFLKTAFDSIPLSNGSRLTDFALFSRFRLLRLVTTEVAIPFHVEGLFFLFDFPVTTRAFKVLFLFFPLFLGSTVIFFYFFLLPTREASICGLEFLTGNMVLFLSSPGRKIVWYDAAFCFSGSFLDSRYSVREFPSLDVSTPVNVLRRLLTKGASLLFC